MDICPFIKDMVENIKVNTQPICFHCGSPYILDVKYCDKNHKTWKPDCKCLTTTAVRIVTGIYDVRNIND